MSRYRAQLGRGRRARRAEALFQTSDPRGVIRSLPGDEFYYVLQEVGFPEALEVLALGTPEQVQIALDFALWDRDQVSLERLDEWLGALVEAPFDTLGRWCKGLDVELLALLLRKRARVYDVTLEEAPEDLEGPTFGTPDGFFLLELLGSEDEVRTTMQLLDSVYRYDADWARRILVGTRGELDAELEETAYRWRAGRMADLGFEDYYDALEIYREIDPSAVVVADRPAARVRSKEEAEGASHLRVPSSLAERLSSGSPFARAISGVSASDELANLHAALVVLSNRVLSADRVRPGDEEAMAAALQRVSATLDLAIEFLAKGSAEEATRAVRSVPMARLFQLGVSLIGKVKKAALALRRRSPFAKLRPEIELFEDEDVELLEAVTRLRPLFPRQLERPPAPGERPFASLADVALATAALERAGAALTLLHGFGVRPEGLAAPARGALGVDAAAIDAGLLARTLLARTLVGAPPALRPLAPAELEALDEVARRSAGTAGRDAIRQRLLPVFQKAWPSGALTTAASAVAERWLSALLDGGRVLGRTSPR